MGDRVCLPHTKTDVAGRSPLDIVLAKALRQREDSVPKIMLHFSTALSSKVLIAFGMRVRGGRIIPSI